MAGGKVMRGLPTAFSISNPVQQFAAGHAACFESALRRVARSQKKPLKDASITARAARPSRRCF
jgi:organic hydroperoxide reductase OsmC/OhrA